MKNVTSKRLLYGIIVILSVAVSILVFTQIKQDQMIASHQNSQGHLYDTNLAYATSTTLTNTVASPSYNAAGKGSQWIISFKTGTTSTIGSITATWPAGFNLASMNRTLPAQGIGAYTVSVTGQTVTWTITTPVSIPAGTTITLFVAKAINTNTVGSSSVALNTYDNSVSPVLVDTGTAPFSIAAWPSWSIKDTGSAGGVGNVGINIGSPAHRLDVGGDIGISGNIVPNNNNDICIGSC